jgi:hypothetical protein
VTPVVSRLPAWPVAAIVTLVVGALAVVWLFPTPIGDQDIAPAMTVDETGPLAVEAAPASYTVQAALYRVGDSGRRERLESGARLALNDRLSLEIEASRDLHVYVVNEDERGRAYALFPLPSLDLENPLAAGRTHVLPGRVDGQPKSWVVDTPGGREHLLVLASPERLMEFEAELNALPRPRDGQLAMALPESARIHLRGIGGMTEAPGQAAEGTAGRLFEMADQLADESETVRGTWVRRIELKNPEP